MKYGDFSSLVQLGVGLHIGTALLQLYGEIGLQPIIRKLTRLRKLVKDEDSAEALDQLDADYEIFKIRLFNEIKFLIKINSAVAALLMIALIAIAYVAEDVIAAELSVPLVALSVLPALLTLGVLWYRASIEINPLKFRADKLEEKVLKNSN